MNLWAYFILLRPLNLLIVLFATFISFYLARILVDFGLFVRFSVPILILAGFSNALNDLLDVEIDRKAHPERPLPKGAIGRRGAVFYVLLLFFLNVFTAFFIPSLWARFLILLAIALSMTYNFILKKLPFVGNLTVSLLTALPFWVVAISFKKFDILWFPVVCSVYYNLLREAIKDAEDFPYDSAFGYKTLPYFLGEKGLRYYCFFLLLNLMGFTYWAFKTGFGDWRSLAILESIWVLLGVWLLSEKSYSKLSRVLKAFMMLVLLGLGLGRV